MGHRRAQVGATWKGQVATNDTGLHRLQTSHIPRRRDGGVYQFSRDGLRRRLLRLAVLRVVRRILVLTLRHVLGVIRGANIRRISKIIGSHGNVGASDIVRNRSRVLITVQKVSIFGLHCFIIRVAVIGRVWLPQGVHGAAWHWPWVLR